MTFKRKLAITFGVIVVAALAFLGLQLAPALFPPTHLEVGAARGEKVPIALPLQDSTGREVTLADYAGRNGIVLVMVRSADWCPFCKAQLKEHDEIVAELDEQGYKLVSLSYDQPEILAEFGSGLDHGYPMLSDPGSRFIDAVGLRDPQYGAGHFAEGVPRATVMVLDTDGTIMNKLVSSDYRQRPDNDFVLAMVDEVSRQ